MKKLTSLLLSIILLISMVSSSALVFAKSQEGPHYKSEIINLKSLDPDTISDKSNSSDIVCANRFLSSGPSEPYRFYSFLDKNQQSVYDAVYNSIMADEFKEEYTVNFPNQIKFDGTIENNNLVIKEETTEFLNQLFLGAMSALIDDYPMMFWISRVGYSFSTIDGEMGDDGIFHAVVNEATITFPLDKTIFNDYNQVKSKYNELENAVKAFTVNGATRYEKVKSIHDSIANLAAYDYKNQSPESHFPTSAILSPYLTVCEGYAESFKLICDREGIPCITVVGYAANGANAEAHAWNYVKMEDNKWYGLDLTWDDQASKLFYDFFLVGANTVAPNFEGTPTFSQSHTPIGDRFPGLFRLTYPMLADNAYEIPKIKLAPPQNLVAKSVTQDAISVSWDRAANATGYNIYVNGTLNNTQPITDTTYEITGLIKGTSYTIAISSVDSLKESETKTEIIVKTMEEQIAERLLGDVTGDGRVTSGDAIAVLRAEAQLRTLTAEEKMAADVVKDNRVTSGDAIRILRYEAQLVPSL